MNEQDLKTLRAEFKVVPRWVVERDMTLTEAREILVLREKALSPRYRVGVLKRSRGGFKAAILDDHHPSGVSGVEVYFTKTVAEAEGYVADANARRVPVGYVIPALKKGK